MRKRLPAPFIMQMRLNWRWWRLSRIVLFWYWLYEQAGALWRALCLERASYWLDFLPAFFLKRYYTSLNTLTGTTGRNLYGKPL